MHLEYLVVQTNIISEVTTMVHISYNLSSIISGKPLTLLGGYTRKIAPADHLQARDASNSVKFCIRVAYQ